MTHHEPELISWVARKDVGRLADGGRERPNRLPIMTQRVFNNLLRLAISITVVCFGRA
jgi:hypothetical protein